ncbi:hypothetical protein PM033_17770, partial [Halorubrum ezzemoulense]|uniref:hypothetical protein n=1 Tax=Halorubrum ezzemoulense TaxID=337243 RepID=UPI00232FCCFB
SGPDVVRVYLPRATAVSPKKAPDRVGYLFGSCCRVLTIEEIAERGVVVRELTLLLIPTEFISRL